MVRQLSKHMYSENRKSVNDLVGCLHNCVYCKPSFQRQAKRFEGKAYDFQPRWHPERLLKAPPKTGKDEFIFFPSMGDIYFATPTQFQAHIDYAKKYSDRTFLIQSKNPKCFLDHDFPDNVILGTTAETNFSVFNTPSEYRYYAWISTAPLPTKRLYDMEWLKHRRKAITIEPILDFHLQTMVEWMKIIKPEIIWIGYDNHNCKLPEPVLGYTIRLVEELRKDFNVRTKSLRKAWYET